MTSRIINKIFEVAEQGTIKLVLQVTTVLNMELRIPALHFVPFCLCVSFIWNESSSKYLAVRKWIKNISLIFFYGFRVEKFVIEMLLNSVQFISISQIHFLISYYGFTYRYVSCVSKTKSFHSIIKQNRYYTD